MYCWMEPRRKTALMSDTTKIWFIIVATLALAGVLFYTALRMAGL